MDSAVYIASFIIVQVAFGPYCVICGALRRLGVLSMPADSNGMLAILKTEPTDRRTAKTKSGSHFLIVLMVVGRLPQPWCVHWGPWMVAGMGPTWQQESLSPLELPSFLYIETCCQSEKWCHGRNSALEQLMSPPYPL